MEKLEPCAPCWCGSGKAYKDCHCAFDEKYESLRRRGAHLPPRKLIKNEAQIEKIRRSAKVNVAVLDYVAEHIRPGISTEEIDRWVYEQTAQAGAIPAPLNYEGFPKSVCTSINEQVCHGIPSPEDILCEGDIVNVDCSTILDGYYSDSSRMFIIGETTPEKQKLVEVTRQCVQAGLDEVKPWEPLGNVGEAVTGWRWKNGYTVVREVGGHGVGVEFHEDPFVSYVTRRGTGHDHGPGHDLYHRAHGQHGRQPHLHRRGQRLDHLHAGRQAVGPMGDSGTGHGNGARSTGLVSVSRAFF